MQIAPSSLIFIDKNLIAMPVLFREKFAAISSVLQEREYQQLPDHALVVPKQFNWVRDVFEPLMVSAFANQNLLELATDDTPEPSTITYVQAIEQCNQLLNYLQKQGVQQGDSLFILCGLHTGLWISYLAAIKGGFVLIPAASILSADDIVYRFQKAAPKVIITDHDNAGKLEQALLQYKEPVKVKLLLDGERHGWMPFSAIDAEDKLATAADTHKDEDLFWFFTSGTTGMPKVVAIRMQVIHWGI